MGIIAEHHDVQLHAWRGSTVPDGFLPSDLQRHITATTPICQPTTSSRSTLPAKHHRLTGFLCGCSIGVDSLPDYLRNSSVGRDKFRQHLNTFMFASY